MAIQVAALNVTVDRHLRLGMQEPHTDTGTAVAASQYTRKWGPENGGPPGGRASPIHRRRSGPPVRAHFSQFLCNGDAELVHGGPLCRVAGQSLLAQGLQDF